MGVQRRLRHSEPAGEIGGGERGAALAVDEFDRGAGDDVGVQATLRGARVAGVVASPEVLLFVALGTAGPVHVR
ncbi:hypothetical protein [Yinghuangia sp. YIM S09857]|uniref:hypothetical protein n=1 Tax=Yinghuangia sp. YIM S09857 TaxID=3436929 RepID=UPI003F52F770